jgi:hypothetical protein
MFEFKGANSPSNLTIEEIENLKGWRDIILWQNIISSVLLALFSMMMWIASAQTLNKLGIRPTSFEAVPQMAQIFTTIYGEWSSMIFLLTVGTALFSSVIGPLYGMARLWEDSFAVHGLYEKFKIKRIWGFRITVILFALIPLIFSLSTEKPLFLFALSGVLFAPIIGLSYIGAIVLSFTDVIGRLHPKRWWAILLALIGAVMTILSSIIEVF